MQEKIFPAWYQESYLVKLHCVVEEFPVGRDGIAPTSVTLGFEHKVFVQIIRLFALFPSFYLFQCPQKATVSLLSIALGFCLLYALLPSPKPKRLPGFAPRDQGLVPNPTLVSGNMSFWVSLYQN